MKELQIKQARLLKLMRCGARFQIENGMTNERIAGLLADIDLIDMKSDPSFKGWSEDQLVEMRDSVKGVYLASSEGAKTKLSGMLEELLQYDLNRGEVTLETLDETVDHIAGLNLRAQYALSSLYAKARDAEALPENTLCFDADYWVANAQRGGMPEEAQSIIERAPDLEGYVTGCWVVVQHILEAKVLPKQIQALTKAPEKDPLEATIKRFSVEVAHPSL